MPPRSAQTSDELDAAREARLRRRFPALRRKLLEWFDRFQRRYPWRRSTNWFHLLMAEMMLRRTRADQAAPVYAEFAARYRNPKDALGETEDRLDQLLEPLGLRWRSRQLRDTIRFLHDRYGVRGPRPEDDLQEAPGVGPYSSAMVRNRLFATGEPAVDSNVARFLARLAGRAHHAESRRDKQILRLAQAFMRHERSWELNLAILDLSAALCKPGRPLCAECPLHSGCATGIPQKPRAGRGGNQGSAARPDAD